MSCRNNWTMVENKDCDGSNRWYEMNCGMMVLVVGSGSSIPKTSRGSDDNDGMNICFNRSIGIAAVTTSDKT